MVSHPVSKVFWEGRTVYTDVKITTMVVDTVWPSTIIGKDTFAKLRATYPGAVSRAFKNQESPKRFKFGGGEQTRSLIKVKLPVYIQDIKDRITFINIRVEMIDQLNLPFLLGGVSLDIPNATLRLI